MSLGLTADLRWAIRVDGEEIGVSGFRDCTKERHHTEKHFLSKGEQWEELKPKAVDLLDFRARLEDATELQRILVLDEASAPYVDTVREHTSNRERVVTAKPTLYRSDRTGNRVPGVGVVSSFGLYTSFAFWKAGIGVLKTSYRPTPSVVRGRLTTQQRVAAARLKLARDLRR